MGSMRSSKYQALFSRGTKEFECKGKLKERKDQFWSSQAEGEKPVVGWALGLEEKQATGKREAKVLLLC